jgi:predicted CxxxxCH...CXXCH cytochrome family protein
MPTRSLLPACVSLALLAACGTARDVTTNAESTTAAAACTRCHGSGDNPAPPRSARGETSTTAIGVGAHQSHLKDGLLHRAFACAECHVVPTDTRHADGVAQVTFGPIANASGVTSTWDPGSATCATYCHGATLPGGRLTTPLWTGGASQAACGSCHGAPPPAPHPQTTDCGACHQGYGSNFVNLALHVDGKVQVNGGAGGACGSCHGIPPPAPHPSSMQCGTCHPGYTSTSVVAATHGNGVIDVVGLSCTSCHGDASRPSNQAAPPVDTTGNTATTARGVGAHQSHLGSALRAGGVACTDCHVVPTSTTHANGTATVTFGGTATLNGQSPSWNTTTLSCSATACHASTLTTGGTARAPVWTTVDGSQKTCGSCHGAPPSSGHHGVHSFDCVNCHGSGYSASGGTVNPALHMDGVKNVGGAGSAITSWNPSTRACVGCHGAATW